MTFFSRGPNKIQQPYTMPDIYASYIAGKSKDDPYYVTYKDFKDICGIFYQMISKSIIDDAIRFKLPWAMGEVFVIKRKVKCNNRMPIDWALTLKEGKRIYNFNEHTGGFGYKFFWTRPYKIKNKFMYRLVLTRQNKRALAKAIKQQKKDYFER